MCRGLRTRGRDRSQHLDFGDDRGLQKEGNEDKESDQLSDSSELLRHRFRSVERTTLQRKNRWVPSLLPKRSAWGAGLKKGPAWGAVLVPRSGVRQKNCVREFGN